MYEKNLDHKVFVRLTDKQFTFLGAMSEHRNISISALLRYIIDDYRRAYEYDPSEDSDND